MFARGVLSPHTAQLPVQKTLATNPRISITSKLIETKRLQALYSGHLRKTGGRGSYHMVNTTFLVVQTGLALKSSYSRTGHPTKDVHPEPAEGIFSDSSVLLTNSPNSNYSRTYATPGGGGVPVSWSDRSHTTPLFPLLRQKQGGGGLLIPIPAKRRAGWARPAPIKDGPVARSSPFILHRSLGTGSP